MMNTLIGARMLWANFREAGHAYRHKSNCTANSITMIVSGEAEYTINGIVYNMIPGKLSLLSNNDTIAIISASKTPFSFYVLNFNLYDWEGKSVTLKELDFPPVAAVKNGKTIISAIHELMEMYRSISPQKIATSSAKTVTLIHKIKTELSKHSLLKDLSDKKMPSAIARAVEHIYTNLNHRIMLDDLAKAACLDASYFNRLFKTATGESPMEFIRRLKIERSKTVLTNSDLSIQQVSEIFGFESQAHYSRQFKTYSGVSPTSYLRKIRG
jgi:AraC-like DNA-binding protein